MFGENLPECFSNLGFPGSRLARDRDDETIALCPNFWEGKLANLLRRALVVRLNDDLVALHVFDSSREKVGDTCVSWPAHRDWFIRAWRAAIKVSRRNR
jgi:hypothetical protein